MSKRTKSWTGPAIISAIGLFVLMLSLAHNRETLSDAIGGHKNYSASLNRTCPDTYRQDCKFINNQYLCFRVNNRTEEIIDITTNQSPVMEQTPKCDSEKLIQENEQKRRELKAKNAGLLKRTAMSILCSALMSNLVVVLVSVLTYCYFHLYGTRDQRELTLRSAQYGIVVPWLVSTVGIALIALVSVALVLGAALLILILISRVLP